MLYDMYKALAHLHACTSRTVNLQHAAVRCVFRTLGVSSAGGGGGSRTLLPRCHSERANRFIISAQTGTFSTAAEGRRLMLEPFTLKGQSELFSARLQLSFSTLESRTAWLGDGEDVSEKSSFGRADRKNMPYWVFYSTSGLLWFNSR